MGIGNFQKNIAELIRRTVTDGAFRQLALTNAEEAYRLIAGEGLPAGVAICFSEGDEQGNAGKNIWRLPPFMKKTWVN